MIFFFKSINLFTSLQRDRKAGLRGSMNGTMVPFWTCKYDILNLILSFACARVNLLHSLINNLFKKRDWRHKKILRLFLKIQWLTVALLNHRTDAFNFHRYQQFSLQKCYAYLLSQTYEGCHCCICQQ